MNEIVDAANITQLNSNAPAVFPMGVRLGHQMSDKMLSRQMSRHLCPDMRQDKPPRYANWVTDKVIQRELYRNIGSSILAIFLTILLFLGRSTVK